MQAADPGERASGERLARVSESAVFDLEYISPDFAKWRYILNGSFRLEEVVRFMLL